MKKSLISVIVPIYNVQDYLLKCLISIENQTYENLEIILVNDGSTDNSKKICEDFIKNKPNFYLYNKKNGGLSDARNYGLKKSKGKYICFIDSDDYIECSMIEELYNNMIKFDSDISCCGKFIEYSNKTVLKNNKFEFSCTPEEGIKRMLTFDEIDNSAWDKLYKRELVINNEFPKGVYYEDMAIMYKIFSDAEVISHTPYVGYHYLIRNNSISNSTFSEKQEDLIINAKKFSTFVENKYPSLKNEAQAFYYLNLMNILIKIKSSKNSKIFVDIFNKYFLEFSRIFKNLLKNKNITKSKKIMAFLIRIKLFSTVVKIKKIASRR